MNYNLDRLSVSSIFLLLVLIFASADVKAGWVITEESSDLHGNRAMQTTFIQDNLIRHETMTSIAIIDLNKNLITIIFSQYRLYWSGTIQELKESTLEAYERKMEEMLVGMPESSRKEFDSIYGELKTQVLDTTLKVPDEAISIVKTDEKEDILGYITTKYNILIDSVLKESVWYIDDIVPYNDINIESMLSFMNQLNAGSGKGSVSQTPEYMNFMKNGMILKSIEYSPDGNNYEVKVTNIRETTIVPEFFKPPVNYVKAQFSDILNLMPKPEQEEEEEW